MVPLPLVIDTISRWSTLLLTVPALVLAQMEGGREVTILGEQTSFQSTSGWLPEPSRAHYPPRKTRMNDLDWVLNGEGTNGIYNSSEAERYGGYNYCNMPHVRKGEYVHPGPDFSLEYAEVVHRHHKRTPYAANLFRDDVAWDCADRKPAQHGTLKESGAFRPSFSGAPLDAELFPSSASSRVGVSGCKFPQITRGGSEDSRTHGADLREVYVDLLGFLPLDIPNATVEFRVTNNEITSQVLDALLEGLYPGTFDYTPIIQSPTFDSLEPRYPCPLATKILSQIKGTNPDWTGHLEAAAPLLRRLEEVSGIERGATHWHSSFDPWFDNLSTRQCDGKPLPCSVTDPFNCISQAEANQVYRLGQWEYSYLWRDAPLSIEYARLYYGAFVLELRQHLLEAGKASVEGETRIKYRHNIAHDGSVSSLLSILQVEEMAWPGMGAEIVFELWRKQNLRAGGEEQSYIRVLWGGKPMETSTPLGVLDLVPLPNFIGYIDTYIPGDIIAACTL